MTLVKQNPKVLNNLFDDLIYNFPYTWGRDVQQNNNVNVPPVNIHKLQMAIMQSYVHQGVKKKNLL